MWRCSSFGISLKKNVLMLAVLDVVISVVCFTLGCIVLLDVWDYRISLTKSNESGNNSTVTDNPHISEQNENIEDPSKEQAIAIILIVILVINLVFYKINFAHGFFLWYITVKKHQHKIEQWLTISWMVWGITIFTTFALVWIKDNIISVGYSQKGMRHLRFLLPCVLGIPLYKIYECWLVQKYSKQLEVCLKNRPSLTPTIVENDLHSLTIETDV